MIADPTGFLAVARERRKIARTHRAVALLSQDRPAVNDA